MEKNSVAIISQEDLRLLIDQVISKRLAEFLADSNAPKGTENSTILLTTKETADIMRCTVQTVYNMRKRGQIKSVRKRGRTLLFEREAVYEAIRRVNYPKSFQS